VGVNLYPVLIKNRKNRYYRNHGNKNQGNPETDSRVFVVVMMIVRHFTFLTVEKQTIPRELQVVNLAL
jgi:hypothetical protein